MAQAKFTLYKYLKLEDGAWPDACRL